jgi:hypothetical protein
MIWIAPVSLLLMANVNANAKNTDQEAQKIMNKILWKMNYV